MTITTYKEADASLTGRCKESRKVANNTYLKRRGDDIAVKLHDTDVVTYHPNGSITLNTGGWYSVTTKERMSRFTNFGVHTNRGEWAVLNPNPNYDVNAPWDAPDREPYWLEDVTPYRDGMTWTGKKWKGAPTPKQVEKERARRKKVRKDINAFIRSITPEQIIRQFENPGGDCFLCRIETPQVDENGWRSSGIGSSPPGDTAGCLASHVEEHYFHLSLMRRAITAHGYRNPDVILSMIYSDAVNYNKVSKDLTDTLRKFLVRNLIEGVATK